MTKEETLQVINQSIDESAAAMKKIAEKLLNAQNWDFNHFGDRNTFARLVMGQLLEKEKSQYNIYSGRKPKDIKNFENVIQGELMFIRAI